MLRKFLIVFCIVMACVSIAMTIFSAASLLGYYDALEPSWYWAVMMVFWIFMMLFWVNNLKNEFAKLRRETKFGR